VSVASRRRARAAAGLVLGLLLGPLPAVGARVGALEAGGYLRETPMLWTPPAALLGGGEVEDRRWTQVLDARGNLKLYPESFVTMGVELKARWLAGEGATALAEVLERTATRQAYFDWQRRWEDPPRRMLTAALDRAWLDVQSGRTQVTLGRQRIAWGTGLVWNPIDILNPTSPLDFDNLEKPGTDGGRVQVYLGPTSKLDLAAVPARDADEAVAVSELVLNRLGWDWIALGGRRGPWTVLGGGWAASVGGAGFRGEFLGSRPRRRLQLAAGATEERTNLVASADGDYTFTSSLYLHAAVLYNARGAAGRAGGEQLLAASQRGWLSPARASLFGEVARNLGQLVRADLAGILDPGDRSWYLGPAATVSALTNLDVTVTALIFGGSSGTEFGDDGGILLVRLQWSF
jgi:hypothetical protein